MGRKSKTTKTEDKKTSELNIPNEYKPYAIWIWNGALDKNKIAQQFDFFINNGFGGVAIKPSRDMNPKFISQDFFDLFLYALQMAQKNKIGIRFVEDFSFCVDNAFEDITNKYPQLRAQTLILESSEIIEGKKLFEKNIIDPHNAIVLFCELDGEKIISSTIKPLTVSNDKNIISLKAKKGLYQFIVFRKKYNNPFCGFLPNPFRSETAELYIKNVFEEFKSRFSKFIPHIFEGFISELPSILPTDNSIPWDDEIVAKYKSKYKENLISLLPCLFFNSDYSCIKTRPQFYTLLSDLLYEKFVSVLEKWCKKNKISNWNLLCERPVLNSTNIFRDQLLMPYEKIGALGIQNQEGTEENIGVLRAVSNINTQKYNRETITVIGRNRIGASVTLQGLKNEIDLNLLNGSSKIILDGFFFSIDKRNYIKTPYNPFWYFPGSEKLKYLCEYSSRLAQLADDIKFCSDVAVLLPGNSIIAEYITSNDESVRKGKLQLNKTIDELFYLNIDFDIITEEMLDSCKVLSNGDIVFEGESKKCNYKALIIPYAKFISKNLFSLIEKMAEKKATIVFIDEPPLGTIEDGVSQSFTLKVEKTVNSKTGRVFVSSFNNLDNMLTNVKPKINVTIQGKKSRDIIATCATRKSDTIYILHNKSDVSDFFASLETEAKKHFYVLDIAKGEIHEIKNVERKDKTCILTLNFAPRQTYFILASQNKQSVTSMPKDIQPAINVIGTVQRNYRIVLKDQWQFNSSSLNALPLAVWNKRIGLSKELGSYSHFYETYLEVKELPIICFLSVFGMMGVIKSYEQEKLFDISINGINLSSQHLVSSESLKNFFPIQVNPPCIAQSASTQPITIEYQNYFDILCNNTQCFNIKDLIRKGLNRISIRTTAQYSDPLPILYPPVIAGSFNIVKGPNGWIIDMQTQNVGQDSWTKYGYPYLTGCGIYSQIFEIPSDYKRLVLKLSLVSGPVSIKLNSKNIGSFNWHPIEVDITDFCQSKRNELFITVMNTADNLIRMNGRSSGILGEVYLDVY